MNIYEIEINNIKDPKEARMYYRLAKIELDTLSDDLLFEDGAIFTDKKYKVEYLKILKQLLRIKMYELMEAEFTDGIIDLYRDNGTHFTITEHNKKIPIGTIEYLDTKNVIPGNISYEIKEEYRGHHYALRALRIVGKELLDHGITSITITATNHDNIPSIKTIEEFGGIQKFEEGYESGPVPFTCDLTNIYSK